jgi:hypothetical protein
LSGRKRFLSARNVYRRREEAPADVFDDIERYQNPRKRH